MDMPNWEQHTEPQTKSDEGRRTRRDIFTRIRRCLLTVALATACGAASLGIRLVQRYFPLWSCGARIYRPAFDRVAGFYALLTCRLVFCVVFGLSMDYEVFLFNRISEAHHEGPDDADALAIGLSTTAGVITSAALIMVLVFGGICWGNFVLIKMLGFTLAAAILIDVTLVRLLIGPALFAMAGRWNWWPRI